MVDVFIYTADNIIIAVKVRGWWHPTVWEFGQDDDKYYYQNSRDPVISLLRGMTYNWRNDKKTNE